MGRPGRQTCKFEDCNNPCHIYPSGVKAAWCSSHIKFRKAKKRNGLDTMTGPMMAVLKQLRAAYQDEYPFIHLPSDVDHRTITALIERDWMIESPGLDGVRYKITGRGLKALKVYEPPLQRRDGLCPMCCERPKHVRKSGKRDAYCLECLRINANRERALGLSVGNPNRSCSRCHKRPRHCSSGGLLSTYCLHCERVRSRRKMRKERKRILKIVRAGGPVPKCKICKQRPRRVFENSVSSFCRECGLAYGTSFREKQRQQRKHKEVA